MRIVVLGGTRFIGRALLVDPARARERLGWSHAEPLDGIRRSVAWHFAHPPEQGEADFAADDRALAAVRAAAPE